MGNCVIVMDDMDEENGGLHYIPTSSSQRKLRRHEDGVVGFSRALADWGPEDEAAEVPLICERGDVIVHHCLTVHRAGLNTTTDRHRRTIGFGYQSVNVVSNVAHVAICSACALPRRLHCLPTGDGP